MTGIGIRGFKGLEEGESLCVGKFKEDFSREVGTEVSLEGWEGFGEEGKRREF